jgi:hypothetical protein
VITTIIAMALACVPQEHGGHGDPEKKAPPTVVELVHAQEASGTAWQPAQTPMTGMHSKIEGWDIMAHAAIFAGFDTQTGDRGDDSFFSTNWIMVMGRRPLGGGEISLRGMASVEDWTVGDRGYPLLLQNGEGLHDRQHPHDLLMELSAAWAAPISDSLGVQFYGGLAGEPALGPVTYHHRHSAAADPMAPLGHHWEDSTHISFGLLTAGLFTTFAKLEASWFNGREPDDNRLVPDLNVPDSGAVRLSVNPTPMWSMQVSAGRLDEPEEDEPNVSVWRTTASTTLTDRIGSDGSWSATALWGRNDPSVGPSTDAFLAEANVEIDKEHAVFGRVEAVKKTGHDLDLDPGMETDTFPVASLSVGYLYTFTRLQDQEIGLGVRLTANFIDRDLEDFYGGPVEWGIVLFLRLRPAPNLQTSHH